MLKNEKIHEVIKNARIKKGYTQAELSELTKVSLRSIQRIENGKVTPRAFTLKTIANQLDLDHATLIYIAPSTRALPGSTSRKVIISLTLGVVMAMLASAFLSQTASFPETTFEGLLFWSVVIAAYGLSLIKVWK